MPITKYFCKERCGREGTYSKVKKHEEEAGEDKHLFDVGDVFTYDVLGVAKRVEILEQRMKVVGKKHVAYYKISNTGKRAKTTYIHQSTIVKNTSDNEWPHWVKE